MKRFAAAAALFATTPLAMAAGPWDAGIAFQFSAFRADASTTVRLDSNGGRFGTTLSMEGDLGVQKTKTLPQFDFIWRITPTHGLEGSYVKLDRDGNRSLTGSIDFGDVTFPINATVNSRFESETYRLAYRYTFFNDSGTELAALLGLHYTTLETGITSGSASISESASVDFPLPTIGLRGGWRFADNWRVTGFAQVLKIKIGDYDGTLANAAGGVEWAFHPNAYAGLGYNYYKYKLTSEKDNAKGRFDYKFDGPSLYAAWAF